ncbi:MAG: hypothetical protein KGJ23_04475 [Euryarchaeota archaeon]|nr:hypothetical protein [Euryarchaeota archaeon]MDE1835855.1 hypothetical protein [Euryarchaeota archaeon]MDE2045830.1 hypothetical protein [Thermoplasmata archaeon]
MVPEALAGPDYPFQGVGSRNAARSVELHLETGYKDEGLSIDMPFLVIMNDALGQTRDILLGRHPLFHSFDFGFRMGFTDDPEIGKWTMREVRKRRDAGSVVRKPRLVGPPP